ncbi:GTP 3',8-cyclase MoaA [Christiangramia flava]|uniref:GTP 3',8-cyclase n=1 Tax=Christiangramia flava JLT2011 TaxID=1229726 RepID=A0A1L7I3T3_9FLAO|nr:GTP 3',8-cyclase MoaA [Christiangramia flava]APU67762.1 Molybdenum cofactor biosynthesis protein MoaA [Christiangramia flava JLT2011]OSS40265.1 Molybdenum cofactor biosynthesis protein MoaA [Christiangramia flava JLT2011]
MIEKKGQIIDNFGRLHNYLRISLTDRCNLRCFYCMPEEGIELMEKESIMSLEEILSLAGTFRSLGVDTVRLTGGEPLVRKNFGYLVEELAKMGFTLKITTNGILLDKYLELFQKIGLRKINLSLDTLDKAKSVFISKRDYFDRIWKNINSALNRGMEVKLNIVLIKGVNDNEIQDFIELTRHKKLTVKFIEFMPFKGNKWDWSKGVGKQEILDMVSERFGAVEELENPKHSTSTNFKVPGHTGSFAIVSTITNPFCDECNRIRLTADGKMKNCLFANSETDLLTSLRNGEPMENLIINAIKTKKHSRDGMDVKMEADHYEKNRSMISIGG